MRLTVQLLKGRLVSTRSQRRAFKYMVERHASLSFAVLPWKCTSVELVEFTYQRTTRRASRGLKQPCCYFYRGRTHGSRWGWSSPGVIISIKFVDKENREMHIWIIAFRSVWRNCARTTLGISDTCFSRWKVGNHRIATKYWTNPPLPPRCFCSYSQISTFWPGLFARLHFLSNHVTTDEETAVCCSRSVFSKSYFLPAPEFGSGRKQNDSTEHLSREIWQPCARQSQYGQEISKGKRMTAAMFSRSFAVCLRPRSPCKRVSYASKLTLWDIVFAFSSF